MSNIGSLKWGVVRWGIILPLLIVLLSSAYLSVTDYLEYPIGTSNTVEVTKNHFFPAITICPYANQETSRAIGITENVTTLSEAIQKALKPTILHSSYILT